jgi:hypothetical protein
MPIVILYSIAAGVIGLLPFSIFLLIPLELVMIYHLSVANKRPFSLSEFFLMGGLLVTVGGILQFVVGTIFVVAGGPMGWIAKAGFAAVFVFCFGWLVNRYYQLENAKAAR